MKRYSVLLGLLLLIPSLAWSAEVACRDQNTNVVNGLAADEGGGPFAPLAAGMVNGEVIDFSSCIVPVGKFFLLTADFTAADAFGTVTAMFNTDPFISFGATTHNLVAGPTTFSFVFGTPVVPGFYSSATSTGGVTVTNGLGGTSTVTTSLVTPTYIVGTGTLGISSTDLGVGLGTANCVAGPGAPSTVSNTCNQGTASNSFAPAFFDNLEASLSYTQNDIASVASWSGAVTLNAATVPEPASLALLAFGLLAGTGTFIRRRK